jgi:hypothetical protein
MIAIELIARSTVKSSPTVANAGWRPEKIAQTIPIAMKSPPIRSATSSVCRPAEARRAPRPEPPQP